MAASTYTPGGHTVFTPSNTAYSHRILDARIAAYMAAKGQGR